MIYESCDFASYNTLRIVNLSRSFVIDSIVSVIRSHFVLVMLPTVIDEEQ